MSKKIGILTQPLHDNYGGLLQAYALKEVIQDMGHEVVIINRQYARSNRIRKYAGAVKRLIKGKSIPPNYFLKKKTKDKISINTIAFKDKYISNLSQPVFTNRDMQKINTKVFDVLLVGSDQCWRPKYSPNIKNYFFDFAVNNNQIKRVSYAASFGVSEWEYTDKDRETVQELIQKFDAISVREESGINLIKNHLGRKDALHLVDPTMLLDIQRYKRIVEIESPPPIKGNLKVYLLDKTKEKINFVQQVEKHFQLKSFEVLPYRRISEDKLTDETKRDFIHPHPTTWLQGFEKAKFVITDSFHGTVFSILFNIPFIAIANKARGITRFESLLKMFGLESQLVESITDIDLESIKKQTYDWQNINSKIETEKQKSLRFLKNAIENKK